MEGRWRPFCFWRPCRLPSTGGPPGGGTSSSCEALTPHGMGVGRGAKRGASHVSRIRLGPQSPAQAGFSFIRGSVVSRSSVDDEEKEEDAPQELRGQEEEETEVHSPTLAGN